MIFEGGEGHGISNLFEDAEKGGLENRRPPIEGGAKGGSKIICRDMMVVNEGREIRGSKAREDFEVQIKRLMLNRMDWELVERGKEKSQLVWAAREVNDFSSGGLNCNEET